MSVRSVRSGSTKELLVQWSKTISFFSFIFFIFDIMQDAFVISYAEYFTILQRQTKGLTTPSLSAQKPSCSHLRCVFRDCHIDELDRSFDW